MNAEAVTSTSRRPGKMAKSSNYLLNSKAKPDEAYVLLTLNCNSRCKHCYIEAGPERKESMPMDLRKRVIDEAAKNRVRRIDFSGGEPTTEMEKLIDTLKYADEVRKKTGYPEDVLVQTNAYFLKGLDESEIKEKLTELKSAGATALHLASEDAYHRIARNEFVKIKNIAKEVFGNDKAGSHGAGKKVVAIGRARKEVPENEWRKSSCSLYEDSLYEDDSPFLTISVDGDVYSCCWQATPPMGDLSKETLAKILKRSRRKDSLFRKLAEKGFSGMEPSELGVDISKEELDGMIEKEGDCAACYQLYLPMKKKSPPRQ